MKKKTIKKWFHRFVKSMDIVTYECDYDENEYNIKIQQSHGKPLKKPFVNRILNNRSFQEYIRSHYDDKYGITYIITKCNEWTWYSIWWYKYPDIKHARKDTKYRFVTVYQDGRPPESYIYEDENRMKLYEENVL